MEANIQKLLDIQEIRHISASYNRYADVADGESFAALWVEDGGEFDIVGAKVFHGREEIAAVCSSAKEILHFAVDSQIEVDGNTATQSSKLLLFHREIDGSALDFACTTTMTDKFVKIDGKWFIKRRQSNIDMNKESAFLKMKLFS